MISLLLAAAIVGSAPSVAEVCDPAVDVVLNWPRVAWSRDDQDLMYSTFLGRLQVTMTRLRIPAARQDWYYHQCFRRMEDRSASAVVVPTSNQR